MRLSRRHLLRGLAAAPLAARAASNKPNIVILLADDLGHGDLGVTGCEDISTPHIDSIAREGARFLNAYSNAPVCSPTRAALLTGRYQQRIGIDHVIYANEKKRGMSQKALLLPEVLRTEGYVSGLIGKWHLGYPKKFFPTRQGFNEFVGFVSGNIDYFAHTDRLDVPDLWRQETAIEDPRYTTDLIGDEAVQFIDRHRQEPFCLYVPFSAPHDPFQGPEHRDTAG
ncbi:MAG: sulfatase-like hydrolase/transferase, partial [bacterium]|nr:sulfatase-like hydrolase/transferase [bacterium]